MTDFETKPAFSFEIIFCLVESEGFHHEGEIPDLILPPNENRVRLKMIKKPNSEELESLILKGGGFPSKNEASEFASKIIDSIYLSGFLLKKAFKIIESSVREGGVLYFGGSGKVSSSNPIDSFVEHFKKAVELSDKLTDKQSLALKLYNMSFFEGSQRAGYISLFIAVEVFVESGKRKLSEIRKDYLKELDKIISKSGLRKQDKDYFKQHLGNLKRESNKKACKRLIEEKLGLNWAEIFETHQKIRNTILHNGKLPDNFENKLKELRGIVSNLLIKILNLSA